jgi:GntR family transcriptional regulator / MocR family aminotransferase
MRIPLDRESHIPLYRQVVQFLRGEILSGALPPETRLPSTRELTESLGASRVVVRNAYAELEADGLVYARAGGGTFVATPPATRPRQDQCEDWPAWQHDARGAPEPAYHRLSQLLASASRPDTISFAEPRAATGLSPVYGLRSALRAVLSRQGEEALGQTLYEAGYYPLRTVIAQILTSEGIETRPENVLVTSGSQQGLNLAARVLLRPGDVVLLESPTWHIALDLFRSLGVRLVSVPVDDQGMRVELVEKAIVENHPRMIYTIPTFHHPTGTCLSEERRKELVAVAARHEVALVEDDFVGSLRFEGRAEPALKALDTNGSVIYLGTFSKVLGPGLRLGFVVADGPIFDRLLAAKFLTDLDSSSLMQRVLAEYITVGTYHSYLRRVLREMQRRRDAMLRALSHHMPRGAQWLKPRGGRYIWLRLPDGLSADELLPHAISEGVIFSPGSFFFPDAQPSPYLRLVFASNPPATIEEGIRRLAMSVRKLDPAERPARRGSRAG